MLLLWRKRRSGVLLVAAVCARASELFVNKEERGDEDG
jgi:hypothetical protein